MAHSASQRRQHSNLECAPTAPPPAWQPLAALPHSPELAALYQTTLDLANCHDLPELLQAIVERAVALIGAHSGAIGLYDAAYDEVELTAQAGARLPYGFRRRRGDGMVGHVIETRSPLIVDDYANSPYSTAWRTGKPPLRAALNVPMVYRDELLGVLSLYETSDSQRTFDQSDANLITALATVAASAVKNARMRARAERSAEMDRIVAGIATRFIQLDPDGIDREIDETLRLIGEFAEVDRSYLFRLRKNGAYMDNTHEWCAEGIEPQLENLQAIDTALMPWVMARLARGEVTHARHLDELPPEAAVEKEVLAAQDIQSVVLIPIVFDAKAIGFIGFDAVRRERSWDEHDIGLLRLIAEVFALALGRAQAERDLRLLNQELEARVAERTAALRAGEEQMRLLVDNSLQGIVLFQNNRLLFANRAMADMVGFSVEELLSATEAQLLARVHPDDRSLIWSRGAVSAPGLPQGITLQFRIFHPDGSVRWIMCMAVVLLHQGAPAIQAVMVDVTDSKRVETALVDALAKERELGELKSRFVAMASHEFRTPLAAILANAETLLEYRNRLDEPQIDLRLRRICGQVDHLANMIDEILSLTKVQGGRVTAMLEAVELRQFCGGIVDEYRGRADIKHKVILAGERAPLTVLADAKLLRTALTNLITNAIKYSPQGTDVTVEIVRRADRAILRVADRGIGIPEKDQARLFEAFHRAGNVGSLAGTGLGLSIAKEFVELMGGAISFESQAGAGTTFEIALGVQAEGLSRQ